MIWEFELLENWKIKGYNGCELARQRPPYKYHDYIGTSIQSTTVIVAYKYI